MKFSDVVGHADVKAVLTSLVDQGKIPHATLLYGPPGIGKMRLARAFVQYINCMNPRNGDSCGVCPACLQTAKHNNPDVHYEYPIIKGNVSNPLSEDFIEQWRNMLDNHSYMSFESWLETIGAGNSQPIIFVSQSEEILRQSFLSTYGNRYKIFVIWLPEKLKTEAANKLLKIIEEPFEDTLFILVSNEPSKILPTIKSRLQSIEVKPLPEDEVVKWMESQGMHSEELPTLARIARGNMSKIVELTANDGELQEFTAIFMDVMRSCYSRKITQMRSLSEEIAAFGREKEMRLLSYFSRMIRESFLSNLKIPSILAMTSTEEGFTEKFGPFIHAGNVEAIEEEVDKANIDISRNAYQKIVWFDLMVSLMNLLRVKR